MAGHPDEIRSLQCPGSIILKTFDLMSAWREEGRTLAGGFRSPLAWECLTILLRGRQPILWMPARHINGMRLRPQLQPAFAAGRLLVLSPFGPKEKRITAALARYRNQHLATLSTDIYIAHAAPGSQILALCRELADANNKPLLTVNDPTNQPLINLGARPLKHSLTAHQQTWNLTIGRASEPLQ